MYDEVRLVTASIVFGFIVGILSGLFIGVWLERSTTEQTLIEKGVGYYDAQTAEFQWNSGNTFIKR
jgi:hypothetical protein